MSPHNLVFFKKKILENSTIGTNCMFFFICIKKPNDQIKSNGLNDITPDLTVHL